MNDGPLPEVEVQVRDKPLTDAEMAVIEASMTRAFKEGYTSGTETAVPYPKLTILLWMCPWCSGGEDPDGQSPGGCLHCGGAGMTNDVGGWKPEELTRAPLPPTLMKAACAGCALREGSPESERSMSIHFGPTRAFFCHAGLSGDDENGYRSPAMIGELPFGSFICRGWWDRYIEETGGPAGRYKDVSASRHKGGGEACVSPARPGEVI